MLHFEGLRKKVIKNYFIIIIITVTLFEGLFMFYVQNYYYNSASEALISKARYIDKIYNSTMTLEGSSLEIKVNALLEDKSIDDGKFAIEIYDEDKNLLLDQYGYRVIEEEKSNKDAKDIEDEIDDQVVEYDDLDRALKDTTKLTTHTYKLENTNEHVMSISVPLKINNIIEGAVRYTVSLEQIDKAIFKLALGLILAGIFILLIAISLSLKFAETLIKPLRELKQFANELAHGNYSIKLKNTSISDDEIGDLAQTFEHMAEEIDKSDKLKEEFISSISHELRTPLTSIKGWSETLGYEGITKDELDLGLGIIQDETERLIKLVEELLDFSRLSSDRIKLQIDMVDIGALCVGVVNQLKVKSIEKNINLSAEFKCESIENIQGDKNRLRQVLINLVQNAIKFTEDNGYIKITVDQNYEETIISVSDNGLGIEKENLDKVLEKFFQEDYNKSGSGLGLAISNEIVKLHGGNMSIESEKGFGTTITFTLKNKIIESI